MFGEPFWFFQNYGEYERGLSSLMISAAMLGMGAALTVRDFAHVFLVWKGFAIGMITQIILIPAWAGLLLALLALIPPGFSGLAAADSTGIAIGIALMAAMPGGSVTNIFTFLGKGNVALSVALTAITTFLCLITTPIVVELLIAFQFPGTLQVDPLRIVLDIALFLIVPLLVGMAVGAVLKERQATFTKIMLRLSLFTLALIIVGSVGAGRVNFPRYGWLGPVSVILFCVVLQQIGRIAARGAGVAEGDCLTIIIEVTIKNGLLALLLITSMFPHDALRSQDAETVAVIEAARDGCTYTVLLFGAVSLILGTISVIQRRSIIGGAG